jgi:RNA polymerase sigma factor FliA
MSTPTILRNPDMLAIEHLHLVPAVARQLRLDRTRRPAAPVDLDDYLAAGAEALLRAARTWDATAGSPFVPYAWTAIGWAMRAEQRGMRWHRQAYRRAARTLISLQSSSDHYPDDPGATIADLLPDPTSHQAVAELRASVQAAIGRLRPKLREVARRYWLDDLPQQAIAEQLGITQPAVAMHLQTARRELARLLEAALVA